MRCQTRYLVAGLGCPGCEMSDKVSSSRPRMSRLCHNVRCQTRYLVAGLGCPGCEMTDKVSSSRPRMSRL